MSKKRFYSTACALDELTKEGVFGEEIKELVSKRDSMPRNDYLYKVLLDWNMSEQIGKEDVKDLIKMHYLKLYFNAFDVDPQGTVDMLTMFWYGSDENPDLECFNSYLESVHLFSNMKNYLNELTKKEKVSLSEKKTGRSMVLNSYSKNVELAGKILAFLICVQKISAGNKGEVSILNIFNETLFNKIKIFNKLSNNKHIDLTNTIDRRIRNAEAHSSIVFDEETNSFVLRIPTKKRIKRVPIPLNEMLLNIIPSINGFIQGFIYSGILLVLFVDDKKLYEKAMDTIINK